MIENENLKRLKKVKWQSYFKGLLVGAIIGGGLEALFIAYQIGALK